MGTVRAIGATASTAELGKIDIPRRAIGKYDVAIDILYCGVCHSDLHTARNEWAIWPTVYPCVPGHEIIGRVAAVGS